MSIHNNLLIVLEGGPSAFWQNVIEKLDKFKRFKFHYTNICLTCKEVKELAHFETSYFIS